MKHTSGRSFFQILLFDANEICDEVSFLKWLELINYLRLKAKVIYAMTLLWKKNKKNLFDPMDIEPDFSKKLPRKYNNVQKISYRAIFEKELKMDRDLQL